MKKFNFANSLLFSLFSSISYAMCAESDFPSCPELGYTTRYDFCVSQNGMPLVCPAYYNEEDNNPWVLCVTNSCRGYAITEDDLDALASDGKTVREHVAELESCKVGFDGENELSLYRVKTCQSGSLMRNGICDVGCAEERYPYDKHPGDLAGEVESCEDTSGVHYGYISCNSGWDGGWIVKNTGYCNLGECSVTDYPYFRDPNIDFDNSNNNINRGATKSCKIGGNTYYRYTDTDNHGNKLTENACGISNNYRLVGPICVGRCEVSNCTKTGVKNFTKTVDGVTYEASYNDWSCELSKDCRVGDDLIYNNTRIGNVVHLPDAEDDRVLAIYYSYVSAKYQDDQYTYYTITVFENYGKMNDTDGKYNTKMALAFMDKQNETLADEAKYSFPLLVKINRNFAPSVCGVNSFCANGEWFGYSLGQVKYLFDIRNYLYHVVGSKITTGYLITTTTGYNQYQQAIAISGVSDSGSLVRYWVKYGNYNWWPALEFRIKN